MDFGIAPIIQSSASWSLALMWTSCDTKPHLNLRFGLNPVTAAMLTVVFLHRTAPQSGLQEMSSD